MTTPHKRTISAPCDKKNPHHFDLTSLDDPTDEQLQFIMEQVGTAARESSRRAKEELRRRMQEAISQMNS